MKKSFLHKGLKSVFPVLLCLCGLIHTETNTTLEPTATGMWMKLVTHSAKIDGALIIK